MLAVFRVLYGDAFEVNTPPEFPGEMSPEKSNRGGYTADPTQNVFIFFCSSNSSEIRK